MKIFKTSFGAMLLFCVLAMMPAQAEVSGIFTNQELWEIGNLWKRTEASWSAEQSRYKQRLNEIKNSNLPEARKDYFLKREIAHHRAVSQQLAVDRNHVHQALLNESSARAAGQNTIQRQRIEASLGTPIGSRDHSGLMSDLDAMGGTISVDKVRAVLNDMGLDHLTINNTAATLEIKGPFDLTLHKKGLPAQVGSEFHRISVQNHAMNKEVFVSQSMGDSIMGGPQAGRSFVEVQDHIKKATPGLQASPQRLATDPDTMQTMMKSTGKAIVAAEISDTDLASIMRQRGIEGTPAEFRERINNTKARRVVISDPVETGKLQAVSQDILNHANNRSWQVAQEQLKVRKARLEHLDAYAKKLESLSNLDNNPALAARKQTLQQSIHDQRQALRQELVDSNTKIDATRKANQAAQHQSEVAEQRTRANQNTQARHASPSGQQPDMRSTSQRAMDGAKKAAQVYGKITDFTDFGQLGQSIEDYIEGNASLTHVIRQSLKVPPLNVTPIGQLAGAYETIEGTSRRLADSVMDSRDASAQIRRANEQNLEAYLTQWELRFRRAGLSADEARRRVAISVKSGDLDTLEMQAEVLRASGRNIESPVLVIEEGIGPDGGMFYIFYNGRDFVYGMADSVYQNGKYIITAPGRVVEALGERELNEAILNYNSQVAETDMQVQLYRSLRQAGIDSERALRAVHKGGAYLREVSQEVQELRAEAEAEALRQAAELAKHEQRVDRIISGLNSLHYMDISLYTNPPTPLRIPFVDDDDLEIEFEVIVSGGFQAEVDRLQRNIRAVTGEEPQIRVDYQLLFDGAEVVDQGKWKIRVPAKADVYPLHAQIIATVSGLSGENEKMHRTVRRDVFQQLAIRWSEETIELEEETYEFVNGDYQDIFAIVTGVSEDRKYYFYWTFRDKAGFTDDPQWKLSAELDEDDKPITDTLTVMLADLRTGTLLDEAHAQVTIHPAEEGEHTQEIKLFENRNLWMTTSVFGNDIGVRFPDITMRVTPTLTGTDGLVPEGSAAGMRLKSLLEQIQNPQAQIRQQLIEEMESRGVELTEAQISEAMRTVMAFAGTSTGVNLPGTKLIDSQYARKGEKLTLRTNVNLPQIPPIRMRLLEADERQRMPRAVDVQMRIDHWQLQIVDATAELFFSEPVKGNNGTATLSWLPEEKTGESIALNLVYTYSLDVYHAGTEKPVMAEENFPLRFENFTMYYPLGFYFLPQKGESHEQ
ncbi:MAG: hypothetical protein EA373_04575 [Oceanospirillales bacterium]|nr:MAG: hypothetical protein EA373_04575 [Oceanospirillales bacterium]